MKVLSPVVWFEGMHLAQHHFQTQSRYVADSTNFALAAVRPAAYGLINAELDDEALLNGSAALVRGRGIMPDGLAFDFPLDPLPSPLPIRDQFSPTRGGQVLALTVPRYRLGRANCALNGEGAVASLRYGVRAEYLVDETSGLDEKQVELAAKNFRLALDPPRDEDTVVLPIARIVRAGSGAFSFDPTFIPPCLQVGGSDRLVAVLRRFVEVLDQRARSLRDERGRPDDALSEYASREVMGFWLSHSIRSALAVVRHLFETRTASPEQLYLELARLAGALCTFSTELSPDAIPLYDHDDLGTTFGELERFVRRGLEVILPRGATRIALIPVLQQKGLAELAEEERGVAQFVFSGSVDAQRAFAPGTDWYLGVRSRLPAGEVARLVPTLIKFASQRMALWLAGKAHPGMPLEHVSAPPAEISPRADTVYFRVTRAERYWEKIVEERRVAAYAPSALPDVELDVIIWSPTDAAGGAQA